MHYIKDIFKNEKSEHAHNKLTRYSKGSFQGPLINLKVAPSGVKVAASFHFVDELLRVIADEIGNEEVHIKGSVVWNKDLSDDFSDLGIKYLKVTKSRGIFKYVLDNNVNFLDFYNKLGKYNVLLQLKSKDYSFSCKSSFPKPNKEFKADFCKCVFPIKMKDLIFSEFAFDVDKDSVKDVKISHRIEVDDIILPENVSNFEEARKLAVRKGSISRIVEVKGKEPILTSTNFEI